MTCPLCGRTDEGIKLVEKKFTSHSKDLADDRSRLCLASRRTLENVYELKDRQEKAFGDDATRTEIKDEKVSFFWKGGLNSEYNV